MLTHASVVATVASQRVFLDSLGETLDEKDVFISYLPLAHIFDRCVERGGLACAARVLGAAQRCRPRLMCEWRPHAAGTTPGRLRSCSSTWGPRLGTGAATSRG